VAGGELNHQISLGHNFANIHPSMLIVAYPCSLYDRLLDNKRVEGKMLWGRRYCYRQRAATMVRCCGQVSYRIVLELCVVCCVVVRGELERLDSTPLTGPLILPHVD
jgi:predicted membrane chloride channel (bestrophin family)